MKKILITLIQILFLGSAWNFEDDTDSTTSSETMTSISDDVPIGSSQLYYTTPPKAVSTFRSKHNLRLMSRVDHFINRFQIVLISGVVVFHKGLH